MCHITIAQTIRHRITTNSLFAEFEIDPLGTYYNRRLLRWAGNVSRMPMSREPRKLLTSWVAKPRPPGDGANAPMAPTATHPGSNPRAHRHSEVVS